MSKDARSFYTTKGLEKLAQIVKSARGDRSFREFEELTKVSHGTLRRIEINDAKMPDYSTLERIAPHTPYSVHQLQLIAMQQEETDFENKKYWIAEDVMPIVKDLPIEEAARLAQMIVDHIMRSRC